MQILFLASEATPLAKVGGLADVAGELPRALRRLGIDVRLVIPFHRQIDRRALNPVPVAQVEVDHRQGPLRAQLWEAEHDGLPIYLVSGEPLERLEVIYGDPALDADRYAFFSLAALAAIEAIGWRPDVVHANDWQTAPAIIRLRQLRESHRFWGDVRSLLTVHNLPFMGAGGESALESYGLLGMDAPELPLWGRALPLPLGLAAADWISTVSPTYAEEIQTSEFGCGLEGFLRDRRDRLVGILNGIDPEIWNPRTDPAIPARYDTERLEQRDSVKRFLQSSLGFEANPARPVLGMITRMDTQKGVDLALDALETLQSPVPGWQFVLLGTGDPLLEERAQAFAAQRAGRAHAFPRFDPELARQIYAGTDLLLIPSRYEPCGLAQMIAMRYGSIPVVRATGGLRDTVTDYESGGSGTGFVFHAPEPADLARTLQRALRVWKDRRRWRPLQRRAMQADFSWSASAEQYRSLYSSVAEA